MKKYWHKFITLALAMLICTFTISLVNSQENNICNSSKKAICLEEKLIFKLENNKDVGNLTPERRVELINNRIRDLADNDSIKLEDLKIETWSGSKITVIRSPQTVIITLTDDDVRAAKLPITDKEKLASQYLERIKNEVSKYRNANRIFSYFGWLNILAKNIKLKLPLWLTFLLLVFLLIIIARFFRNITLYKFQKIWHLINDIKLFSVNSIGRFFELLILLIIVLFIFRLFLIIFTANREAFFSKNITRSDWENLFTQIFATLRIIGLIFLFGIGLLLFRWLSSQKNGIIVIPFVDLTTSDQALDKVTSNDQKIGKAITNSLVCELDRIRHINTLIKPESDEHIKLQISNIPPLFTIRENLENNLSNIGIVEVGKARIPVGAAILGLRVLWPFGGINKIISGDIQKIGNKVRLVVRLEDQNEIKTWDVLSDSMLTFDMIREIAYKLSIYLSPNITAKTWEGFQFFTEAIASYDKYRQTQDLQHLQQAYEYCIKAKTFEIKYEKLADLLYEIGISYLEKQDHDKGQEVLLASTEINPHNKYLHNALGNLYFANKNLSLAETEYNISLILDKNFSCYYKCFAFLYENLPLPVYWLLSRFYKIFPYPYNGLGNVYYEKEDYEHSFKMYEKAIKFKKDFSRPYHNLANIYIYGENKKNYEKAIKNYEKARKYSDNKLIMPYVGLSMVYLLQAQEEVNNEQARNHLLEKAKLEITRAMSIKDEYFLEWNLGIITICQGFIDDSLQAWEKALRIAQAKQTSDQLFIAFCQYLINALTPENYAKVDKILNKINNILNQDIYKSQIGTLKQFEKDFMTISTILASINNPKLKAAKLDELIEILQNKIKSLKSSRSITNQTSQLENL